MLGLFIATILILLLFLKLKPKTYKLATFPKGPNGLPILGNLLQFAKTPHLQLAKWAKIHGNIFTIYLAGKPVLVINKKQPMTEIFGSLESTGKFPFELFDILYPEKGGIVNSQGEVWLEQQRFCMKALKELGFGGGSALEPVLLAECDELCAWIDQKLECGTNEEIYLNQILLQITCNTIWRMVTGEKVEIGESKVVQLLQKWMDALNVATKRGLAFLPWLKHIAPEMSGYNAYVKSVDDFHNLVKMYLDKHKMARQMGETTPTTSGDLIDAYLDELESCKNTKSSFYGETGYNHAFLLSVAFLLAGSETTASTLNWLIFYLVVHQDVQRRVQEEIEENLGTGRDPTLADRHRMKYTDAVVMETLRYSSLLPFGSIHELLGGVSYNALELPKGTLLLANLYYANRDPEVWGDPEVFRPERFLVDDESEKKRLRDCVVTFHEGRRRCPGEPMAKDTMFLFTAKLFQKYDFHAKQGKSVHEYLEPIQGYVLVPPKLPLIVKRKK